MPAVNWTIHPDDVRWKEDPDTTERILARRADGDGTIPVKWTQQCFSRVREMRNYLRSYLVGLDDPELGHLLDWALACLIARENLLLIGPPGVAKTEIAEQIFRLLGLKLPRIEKVPELPVKDADIHEIWEKREREEGKKQKYFRYLLSRYTQPEELFGPIEIDLLKRGMLVHVNFGLLTSPGVRGAFLDEIFKASSSILNTLLTVVLEHEYFNWGGMRQSDLVMLIGASNELPGGFAGGHSGVGSGGEDFSLLYAFLDRFPLRLDIPNVSGTSTLHPGQSLLTLATEKALEREAQRFTTYQPLNADAKRLPSINDTLVLGRAIAESFTANTLFDDLKLKAFKTAFHSLGANLRMESTGSSANAPITWTISPRKMKALYKIALAHALVVDDSFGMKSRVDGPNPSDLHVFNFIWDTGTARELLRTRIQPAVDEAAAS